MNIGKFLVGPIGSAFRVFVGLVLGSLVMYLLNGGTFTGLDWGTIEAWVGAAAAVALPIVVAALNPADTRFGTSAK